MPRGDRTGPMGMGAMTGRAAGYCSSFEMLGYANPRVDRAFSAGRWFWGRGFGGGGRGWRHWFYATGVPGWIHRGAHAIPYLKPDSEVEKRALEYQTKALQAELAFVKDRLDELETDVKSQ